MKLLLLIIPFLIMGCSKNHHDDKVYYLYGSYDMDGKYLGSKDTVSMKLLNDSTFNIYIYRNGLKKQFKVEQTSTKVNLITKENKITLFNTENDSIYINPEASKKIISPYLVNNTEFLESREFNIDNKKYLVSMFRTNNHSTINDFVYYSPEFGFIYYVSYKEKYKKLIDIINLNTEQKKLALQLTKEVLKDSTFFAYGYTPKPPFMKFSVPK